VNISLPERAKTLRDRLAALEKLEGNVKEAGLLEDLRSHLEPEADALYRALAQRKLLFDLGVEVDPCPSLASARTSAASLLLKFNADKQASTLKKGVGWTKLVEQTKAASRDLGALVAQGWKVYVETIFTGEAPGVIRGRIAFTDGNNAAFKEYTQLYQAFSSASDKFPADRAGVENIRALAAALATAAHDFDFNVPHEVKLFLEAIQSGGAPLDLLTDTVHDWLGANDALESYRIVPRSLDGRR
jgi:hypothetical protein